ncbi:MAG: MBL fold metallo-hydrolase [Anaerolineae bacterium]
MIETLTVGPLQTNCYIYTSDGDALVVDAAAEPERILEAARRLGAHIRYLVNTHAHFDHIGALAALASATDAPVLVHEDDIPLLLSGGWPPQLSHEGALPSGFPTWMVAPVELPQPPRPLQHGDRISIGTTAFDVIHTPGHTPGSICLYCTNKSLLFSGDTLFHLGVGRADMPGGHGRTLLHSIKERLFILPDDTRVYPGHGPSTTIGLEKRHNPFVRPAR